MLTRVFVPDMLAEKLADMILQDGSLLLSNQNLGDFQELRVQTPA